MLEYFHLVGRLLVHINSPLTHVVCLLPFSRNFSAQSHPDALTVTAIKASTIALSSAECYCYSYSRAVDPSATRSLQNPSFDLRHECRIQTLVELEIVNKEALAEPDFRVGVEESLVVVVGHSSAILNLSNHVTDRGPRYTLFK